MSHFILITSAVSGMFWTYLNPVAAHPQITSPPTQTRAAVAESEIGYFSSGRSYYLSACGSDSTWMVTSRSTTPSSGSSADSYGGCCPSGLPCTKIGYFCYNANTVVYWEDKGSSFCQGSSVCDINTIYKSEDGEKVATYYHCGTTDRRSLYQTVGAAEAGVPIASTTFFVDPTSNQIAINSADPSGTSQSQSSESSSDSPSPSTAGSSNSSNNAATIGGAVGGGIGGLIIICLLSYIFLQRRKQKQKPNITRATPAIPDGSTTHVLKPELHAEEGSGSGREELDVAPHVGMKAQTQGTTVRELELDGTERQRPPSTPAELVAGKDVRTLGKTSELGG